MAGLFDRSQPHDERAALFGGRKTVRVWSLGSPSPSLPFKAVLACELDAGGSVGTHVQQEYAEIVICIAGAGRVALNGAEHDFRPGDVVALPLGHTLAIDNAAGSDPLRYLIVKAD